MTPKKIEDKIYNKILKNCIITTSMYKDLATRLMFTQGNKSESSKFSTLILTTNNPDKAFNGWIRRFYVQNKLNKCSTYLKIILNNNILFERTYFPWENK